MTSALAPPAGRGSGRRARPTAHTRCSPTAFYLDALYDRAIVRPIKALARAVVVVDDRGVDATAVGAGRGARLAGGGLRWLQNGNAQRYATGLVLGVVIAVLAVSV